MEEKQPSPFNVNYHLGRFHRVSRRYSRAIRLHQEALEQRERALGPDHPDTLRSSTALANSFYAAGHFDMALELFRETLDRRARTLGPEHPDTLRSRGSLGNCYHAMGDHRNRRPDAPGNPDPARTYPRPRPSQHPGQPQQPPQSRAGPVRRERVSGRLGRVVKLPVIPVLNRNPGALSPIMTCWRISIDSGFRRNDQIRKLDDTA